MLYLYDKFSKPQLSPKYVLLYLNVLPSSIPYSVYPLI